MKVEDVIRNALNELTSDGTFYIDRIDYNEKNFGNTFAVLNSNNQVDIRFIKDRGIFWCEVGQAGEWYFLEDVFTFIDVAVATKSSDFIDFITEMSVVIKKNLPQILRAFNPDNLKDMQSKIKAIATKRAMGIFKL